MSSTNIKIEIRNFTDFSMKEGTFLLEKGENVLSVLIKEGVFDTSHCGGHGTCGKCAVRFIKGAPLPMPADRRRFTPKQLRDGCRLACMAKPQQDCEMELLFEKKQEFILEYGWLTEEMQDSDVTLESVYNRFDENKSAKSEKEFTKFDKMFVIGDIGTTTIVLQLVTAKDGKVIDTYKRLNPQRKYGADVVSRMQSALDGNGAELSELVKKTVDTAVTKWKDAGYNILKIVLAGNTVMTHLYMGFDVTGLSKAPFTPVTCASVPVRVCGVDGCFLPSVSAFVGGDIVAGILACKEQMKKENVNTALFIDLGTNGEMAIIGENGILCTATAAGPAFEGQFADVWGSQLIDMVAYLRKQGIVDETGLMKEPYFSEGVMIEEIPSENYVFEVYKSEGRARKSGTDDRITICRKDIRRLQEAKAAVFAGIRILLEEYGMAVLDVERVYLAGGFGYQTNVDAACRIGLLPSELKVRTRAVGNTALAGAYLYAKMVDAELTEGAENTQADVKQETARLVECGCIRELLEQTSSMNLAQQDRFHAIYLESMDLKEMDF